MKKTLLITLIILLIVLGAYTMIQGYSIGPINILSYSGIKEKDNVLQQKIDEVQKLATVDFTNETKSMEENKNKLKKTRGEYEDLVQVNPESGEVARQLQQYETEYLWTKIGNHARTEGVTLKIDITKTFDPATVGENSESDSQTNTTSENTSNDTTNTNVSSTNTTTNTNNNTATNTNTNNNTTTNTTSNETTKTDSEETTKDNDTKENNHYDLKFTVSGSYVGIADFLYDIENDSTLAFKIDDFMMSSTEDTTGLVVVGSFTCKDIAIKDLIKTSDEQREYDKLPKDERDNNNTTDTDNTSNNTKRNTSNSSNTTNSSN